VLSATQVLAAVAEAEQFSVSAWMGLPLFVPETLPADELLVAMREQACHLAIVLDEYGQTAGLATDRGVAMHLIRDLAQVSEPPDLLDELLDRLPDDLVRLPGDTRLATLEERLGVSFPDPSFETVGGALFGQLGRRPQVGDVIPVGGWAFTIEEVDGLRIARVRLQPAEFAGQDVASP
jgi:CBS domain containing-hemolysin-like protein